MVLIGAIGWVESAQPFGIRFRDFTGGMVTFDTLIRIGILTIVLVGLNLLMGYAGQISLGQAAFYGIGAYASAIMTTLATRHGVLPGISQSWWWPWLAMVGGMVITGSFAYLIGKPILRLRGNYLAMATLGLGIIAFLTVPLSFLSIRIWRTIHPVIVESGEGMKMTPNMQTAFFFALFTFTVFGVTLLWHRIRIGEVGAKIEELKMKLSE